MSNGSGHIYQQSNKKLFDIFCNKNLVEYKRVFKSWSDEMNWVNGAHSESRLGKL